MQKTIAAISFLIVASLSAATQGQAHDRHQVIVEMQNGEPLLVDMDEWAITSLLVMDFAFDEMAKVADPENHFSRDMQLYRLRTASAVVQHKISIFGKMVLGAAETMDLARTRELSNCNLALENIDKKISNTIRLINDEDVIFDPATLRQSFQQYFALCVAAIKQVN